MATRRDACVAAAVAAAGSLAWALLRRRKARSGVGVALPYRAACVYLDWNATSPIFPEVTEAMLPFVGQHFGNPSSSHAFGVVCGDALSRARAQVATLVGGTADEIVFCGCGSEADNLALRGVVLAEHARRRGARGDAALPHVICTNIEHPAVTACLRALESEGLASFTPVPVDRDGLVAPAAVAAAVTPATVLVTIMHSNNEVGSVQPLRAISSAVRAAATAAGAPRAPLVHTDAAQSIGKVPVKAAELEVDLITIVGHKFGAPKGCAALFVRAGVELKPIIHGGGQEHGLRAGTECVPLCVGLGAAAAVVNAELSQISAHMLALRARLYSLLARGLGEQNVRVNGPARHALQGSGDAAGLSDSLPNTLSIGLRGVKAARVLAALNDSVAASASAACHTADVAKSSISFVLRALDVPIEFAVGTLRLSVGRHTTRADIERAAGLILSAAKAPQ